MTLKFLLQFILLKPLRSIMCRGRTLCFSVA